MKKRSKLELSPDARQKKSQAAGFGPEVAAGPATEAKHSQRRTTTEAREAGTVVDEGAVRSSRTLIVTSMAFVAVATALLFLLKRR